MGWFGRMACDSSGGWRRNRVPNRGAHRVCDGCTKHTLACASGQTCRERPTRGVGVGRWGSDGWAARASGSRGGGNGPQPELGRARRAGRRRQIGRLGRGSEVDRPEVVFLFFFSILHLFTNVLIVWIQS